MRYKSILLKVSLGINLLFVLFFVGKRIYYGNPDFFNPQITETDKFNAFSSSPIDTLATVFVGTSLTAGFPVKQEFKNDTVWNIGASGSKSDFILERFRVALKHRPNKIFIEAGVNDIYYGVSTDTLLAHINTMIQLAKQTHTRIYIQSILPTRVASYNKRIPTCNAAIKQLCEENNVPFINTYPAFLDDKGLLDEDLTVGGIHLTAAGYYVWRKQIYNLVTQD